MDIEYYSIENQIKRINEYKFINEKKKEFKIILKNNPNSISAHWLLTKENIDFKNLPEKKPTFIIDSNYEIYWVNLKELLNNLNYDAEKVYSKKSIWTLKHNDNKITRVLIHWQNKEKLIPVILNIPNHKSILIQDGHHRLTVSNYLDLEKIPVIVSKNFEAHFLSRFAFFEKI